MVDIIVAGRWYDQVERSSRCWLINAGTRHSGKAKSITQINDKILS